MAVPSKQAGPSTISGNGSSGCSNLYADNDSSASNSPTTAIHSRTDAPVYSDYLIAIDNQGNAIVVGKNSNYFLAALSPTGTVVSEINSLYNPRGLNQWMLTTDGFRLVSLGMEYPGEPTSDPRVDQTLRWLLKQFVDAEWIDERLRTTR